MKKQFIFIAFLFSSALILNACVNSDNEMMEKDQNENGNDQKNDVLFDNTFDLGIGETGSLGNEIGKVAITLDSVEIVEGDMSEQEKKYYPLIRIYLTVENIDNKVFSPEEMIYGGILLETNGEQESKWMYYGATEKWGEELEPGDKTSGMVTFAYADFDEYELMFGNESSSEAQIDSGNNLSFTFKRDGS